MQMARSTYYFELSKADQVAVRNHCLADEIKDIFSQHKGRYGVRRVYQELIKRSHKRSIISGYSGLCILWGRQKAPKEKYHSYKGEVGKVAENILDRDFSTTAPMQKWTTDVSQFGFSWGKCYLSPILDMNTNEIISYDLSQSANMEQIQRMLAGAFTKFPSVDGLIFHSDQGWQYQHVYFRQALKKEITKSFNPCQGKETVTTIASWRPSFGRMKNEMFYRHEKEYSSFETFAKAVDGYISYYNNERIREKNGCLLQNSERHPCT